MSFDDFDFADILTKTAGAILILLVTWILARIVKTVLGKQLSKIKALQRDDGSGHSLGESLGAIAALIIWLFGLIAVLNLFDLSQAVTPIQNLLDGALAALPGILGAGLLFFIGLVLAKVVRELVETALRAAGADTWLNRLQGQATPTGSRVSSTSSSSATSTSDSSTPPLSKIAGQLVYVLVLVVISISALQVLGIEAIAGPATEMLNLILNAIPSILAAAILLGIGFVVARFIAPVLEATVAGLGVDRALGDLSSGTSASTSRKPSAVIGTVAQIAIMLFFAIAATRVLGFPEITEILDTILSIGGSIILGGAIIAAGVFLANLIPRFVSGQVGQIIRYAAIALFVAIGLGSMGLAESVVNLAFGAIVIGAAAAAALAFGLGGREAAARELADLQNRRAANREASAGASTTGQQPLA